MKPYMAGFVAMRSFLVFIYGMGATMFFIDRNIWLFSIFVAVMIFIVLRTALTLKNMPE